MPSNKQTKTKGENMKELTSGNVMKLNEGQSAEGTFQGIEVSAQFKDSYALKMKIGNNLQVIFVSNIVKDLLTANNVQVGDKIKVHFKGMKSNKSGTAKYKDYAVYTD